MATPMHGLAETPAYNVTVDEEGMDDVERQVRANMQAQAQARDTLPDPEGAPADTMGKGGRIVDRETDYQKRRLLRGMTPARADPYAMGDQTPDAAVSTYADTLRRAQLSREADNTMRNIQLKQREASEAGPPAAPVAAEPSKARQRRNRWGEAPPTKPQAAETPAYPSLGDATPAYGGLSDATPVHNRWSAAAQDQAGDQTPAYVSGAATPVANRWDATPTPVRPSAAAATPKRNRWDATPSAAVPGVDATPGRSKRSRWDETPAGMAANMATPAVGATPFGATPGAGAGPTPVYNFADTPMATPAGLTPSQMTPEQFKDYKASREMSVRNKYLSDAELDSIMPGEAEGYKILPPPSGYQPIRTPARKLVGAPDEMATPGMTPGYVMPADNPQGMEGYGITKSVEGLPDLREEDMEHFGSLLQDVEAASLSVEEQKEQKVLKLLLKIKNGTPAQRKSALRHLTDKARDFGPKAIFEKVLPLMMSPALEDQERHLLVKVMDRVLFKLDELVRPWVHKILAVTQPLLIDEDYYGRVEGREVISNLCKAAGLPTMFASIRPDIDHVDEYVRNCTARTLSVMAQAMGIPMVIKFIKAVCASKKSWQARHTGIKSVQQIAILMGCAVLPHLTDLVHAIMNGLLDENQKVKTITALALAALAEAAAPYGIESFDAVLTQLWKDIKLLKGKVLAAYLKAVGHIIPLMDNEPARFFTEELMLVLVREFQTSDEEMKKIVLKVIQQTVSCDGVDAAYVRAEVINPFFSNFWNRKMAMDRRNYRALVETTVSIADKVGAAEIVGRIVDDLKDESEPYRRMVMETVDKVIGALGAADVDARLEELLIDGVLYAYQEQMQDESVAVLLNGFGTVVNALGKRAKPYLPQINGTIKWRLNHKLPRTRQQAADLISRIAVVMKQCGDEKLLTHLGIVLYENIGEEYPEVLGSILGAIKSIVNVVGMEQMQPPIKDLLPRLTPILRNRHEKVQENCIDLVGRIADRGAEHVPAREWMRVCFDLLDMLNAHKKAIRRAANNTFGYIAKAIGPSEVLATLLDNLKVQERQNRVCTAVAIAIVAETCHPFTVLPGLMNEYRVPELNVQNGVLKALSFMFEYIGEMGRDYIYAVAPLLEDAMMDRDLVHRQTATSVIMHVSLGVVGLGCEDIIMHLLNYVWPNIFEESPHLMQAVAGAIDGARLSLGPSVVMAYILQGLFHPARKVRTVYWKLYNNLYIGAQDSLTGCYPAIPEDQDPESVYVNSKFCREELDVFV